MSEEISLLERIERLESIEEIRQLPAKYALSIDMRDWDSLVNLFVPDAGVPGKKRGRQELKKWYDAIMRDSKNIASAHATGGHIIELQSPDHATGIVYSRNDLEQESEWLAEVMTYLDRYERRDGLWLFASRTPLFLYECDMRNPPLGEKKLRFPGREYHEGTFHAPFPSWEQYWNDVDTYGDTPVAAPASPGRFLETIRRGRTVPKSDPGAGIR